MRLGWKKGKISSICLGYTLEIKDATLMAVTMRMQRVLFKFVFHICLKYLTLSPVVKSRVGWTPARNNEWSNKRLITAMTQRHIHDFHSQCWQQLLFNRRRQRKIDKTKVTYWEKSRRAVVNSDVTVSLSEFQWGLLSDIKGKKVHSTCNFNWMNDAVAACASQVQVLPHTRRNKIEVTEIILLICLRLKRLGHCFAQ